ncbi:hypothetical protein [Niveispirillum sp. KHB5.9]|uniref:hypothetical protein n=1 Tax=Niveispirillum sp. KHB5.9 TaxID=3400269 RepID=UPI003A8827F0
MTEMTMFFVLMVFVWSGVMMRHLPFNAVAVISKKKKRYKKSIKADIGFSMFFGFFTLILTVFALTNWLPANVMIGFLLISCCISLVVVGLGLQEESDLNK